MHARILGETAERQVAHADDRLKRVVDLVRPAARGAPQRLRPLGLTETDLHVRSRLRGETAFLGATRLRLDQGCRLRCLLLPVGVVDRGGAGTCRGRWFPLSSPPGVGRCRRVRTDGVHSRILITPDDVDTASRGTVFVVGEVGARKTRAVRARNVLAAQKETAPDYVVPGPSQFMPVDLNQRLVEPRPIGKVGPGLLPLRGRGRSELENRDRSRRVRLVTLALQFGGGKMDEYHREPPFRGSGPVGGSRPLIPHE